MENKIKSKASCFSILLSIKIQWWPSLFCSNAHRICLTDPVSMMLSQKHTSRMDLYDSQHDSHCLSWHPVWIKILLGGKHYCRGQNAEVGICTRYVGLGCDRNPSLCPWLCSLPGARLLSHTGSTKVGGTEQHISNSANGDTLTVGHPDLSPDTLRSRTL